MLLCQILARTVISAELLKDKAMVLFEHTVNFLIKEIDLAKDMHDEADFKLAENIYEMLTIVPNKYHRLIMARYLFSKLVKRQLNDHARYELAALYLAESDSEEGYENLGHIYFSNKIG